MQGTATGTNFKLQLCTHDSQNLLIIYLQVYVLGLYGKYAVTDLIAFS